MAQKKAVQIFEKSPKKFFSRLAPKWSSMPAAWVLGVKFGTLIYGGKPKRMAGKDLKVKNLHRKIFDKIAKKLFSFGPQMVKYASSFCLGIGPWDPSILGEASEHG